MQLRAGRRQDGQLGGGDTGAGPAAGDGAFGGPAAARAVVDVPDELAAQGGAEHELVLAGETGHTGTAAGLDDGERRARALDLAGGGGEQFAGGGQVLAEDGGDLVGGEVVAYGEFERLALFRGGAGGLRPGELGQLAPTLFPGLVGGGRACRGRGGRGRGRRGLRTRLPAGAVAGRRVRALTFLLGLGELAQARPAGQRVEPGPPVARRFGAALTTPFGEREDVTEGGGGGFVVAQDGQAVGEQAVQVGLVARGRSLRERARRSAVPRLPVRPVCAGHAGRDFRAAAHHPCDRRRRGTRSSCPLSPFNPYG